MIMLFLFRWFVRFLNLLYLKLWTLELRTKNDDNLTSYNRFPRSGEVAAELYEFVLFGRL